MAAAWRLGNSGASVTGRCSSSIRSEVAFGWRPPFMWSWEEKIGRLGWKRLWKEEKNGSPKNLGFYIKFFPLADVCGKRLPARRPWSTSSRPQTFLPLQSSFVFKKTNALFDSTDVNLFPPADISAQKELFVKNKQNLSCEVKPSPLRILDLWS